MSDADQRKKAFTSGYLAGLCGMPLAAAPMKEQEYPPVLAPADTWTPEAYAHYNRYDYTAVHLVDTYTPTGAEVSWWAADQYGVGSVMCYEKGTELYIAGNGSGKIIANQNSKGAFVDFQNVIEFTGLDLLDTSNVTNMSMMFMNCYDLQSLNLSGFDTKKVIDISAMFLDCGALSSVDLSSFDTSNVTTMYAMFVQCGALTSLDLRSFNTKNVKSFQQTFYGCTSLTGIYVGAEWQVSSDADTLWMFRDCGVSSVTYA